MYAYILLGYLLQPDKIHGDVGTSSQSSTINKDVFQELMNALFDEEFLARSQLNANNFLLFSTFANDLHFLTCRSGAPVRMPCGRLYQARPHLLLYLGDLPQLALVTLTRQGSVCPMCTTKKKAFTQRCKDPKLHSSSKIMAKYLKYKRRKYSQTAIDQAGKKMGVHLRPARVFSFCSSEVAYCRGKC